MGVPLIENSNLKRKMKSADRISVFRGVWFPRPTLVWPGSVVKSETPKWANQRPVSRSFAYRQFDWIFIEIANFFSPFISLMNERPVMQQTAADYSRTQSGGKIFFVAWGRWSRPIFVFFSPRHPVECREWRSWWNFFSEANDTHRQFQPFRRLKCKMNQVPPGGLDWISLVFSRMNVTSPPGGTLI